MINPVFSVVIPLFNKEKHIHRAIDSVLNQIFIDFEIIVIDDGSTDNSGDLVKNYNDSRIKFIRQNNQGVSAARNKGIDKSSGQYIAFIDADDEWTEEHLRDCHEMITIYPDSGIYATAYKKIEVDGSEKKLWNIEKNKKSIYQIDYFKESYRGVRLPFFTSSVCIPKNIFEELGTFALGQPRGEDLDMWGRIALYKMVVFSENVTVTYYKDAQNRSTEKTDIEELPFVNTYRKLQYKDKKLSENIYIMEFVAMQQFNQTKIYLFSGQSKKSRQVLYDTKTILQKKKWFTLFILTWIPYYLLMKLSYIKRKVF